MASSTKGMVQWYIADPDKDLGACRLFHSDRYVSIKDMTVYRGME